MEITRVLEFKGLHPDPTGKAFLMRFDTNKGPLNLECEGKNLEVMFRAVFAAAQRYGETAPPKTKLKDVVPANSVLLPTEELATTSRPEGGLWLMFRVGSVDLSVAMPDPEAAKSLAGKLLDPD